ncbi:MAG: hypothetical protein AAF900_01410 [Bacteroidota bacterium]
MFRKSILQLHLKDKLFFILIAILAAFGVFFAIQAGATYVSGSIKGHGKEINDTKNQFGQLEEKYGPYIKGFIELIEELQGFCTTISDFGWYKAAGMFIVVCCAKDVISTVLLRLVS